MTEMMSGTKAGMDGSGGGSTPVNARENRISTRRGPRTSDSGEASSGQRRQGLRLCPAEGLRGAGGDGGARGLRAPPG